MNTMTHYNATYVVNPLARSMSKKAQAYMAAANHPLFDLVGKVDFAIKYKRGGSTLTASSNANWGNNQNSGKSMSSFILFLPNAPASFKVRLRA